MDQEEDFETYQARIAKEQQESPDTKGDTWEDAEDDQFERAPPGVSGSAGSRGRLQSTDDLRQFKIGAQDYLTGQKKGRYGITVPRPFAFDIRDKMRPKSIRERKIERMIAEKEAAETEELKNKYRAKPIPPEVV